MQCMAYFDILNCKSPEHQCDRQTDREMYGENCDSNSVRLLLCWLNLPQELTLPDGLSVIQHLQSGTHFLEEF